MKQTKPGVFAVKVEDEYHRAMLFLRCQEHYESNLEGIRGSHFDIFEYMDKYRKWKGEFTFTYTQDWAGFNVPDYIVETCTKHVLDARNGVFPTPYDYVMASIIESVKMQIKGNKRWYLLGVDSFESQTMDHEVAHGLYYVSPKYKKVTSNMVHSLPPGIYSGMKELLLHMGYCDEVISDEIQAFLSTGITGKMSEISGISKYAKEFKKHFDNFKVK